MHAHGRNAAQAMSNGKEVYHELRRYPATEPTPPNIDICYNAMDRIRELHFMNRERFLAMLYMAYAVVKNNSTWMLAQRKDGMTQAVKRENKGMHAPVMKSLGFAMGDLQQSHRSRISQDQVRAVTEDATTTEDVFIRIGAFIDVFKNQLNGVTVHQELWHSLYDESDTIVGYLMTCRAAQLLHKVLFRGCDERELRPPRRAV